MIKSLNKNMQNFEYLKLYASLLRKYYIGEEDYMLATLNNISTLEINKAWKYALKEIKHDERIKNPSSIPFDSFEAVQKKVYSFHNVNEKVKYLFSHFNPSELKLNDEIYERRLRYILAIKTLKILEFEINTNLKERNQIIALEAHEKKLKTQFELEKSKQFSQIRNQFKKRIRRNNIVAFILLVVFPFLYINTYKKNQKLLEERNHLQNEFFLAKRNIELSNKRILKLQNETSRLKNLLNDESYLNRIFNEKKYFNFKQNKFSGKISLNDAFGYKSIRGELINGEERGIWTYDRHDGGKDIFKWVKYRVGAYCRDGDRSYSTGRGTCSHHGGVDYWITEYQRERIQ
jgi:hypothetical protein